MTKWRTVLLFVVIILYALSSTSLVLSEESKTRAQPSFFQKAKNLFNSNSASNKKRIRELQEEIRIREKALTDLDTFITNTVNNARPRCAGGSVTVSLSDDPREEVRSEIRELKQQIKQLQY